MDANGEELSPRPRATELSYALVGTGFGYAVERRAREGEIAARVLSVARDLRRIGSAALDLAWTACGRLDAFYERGLNPWDAAAGMLICARAGLEVRSLPAAEGLPAGVRRRRRRSRTSSRRWSGLRADERVELGDGVATGNRDVLPAHRPPRDVEGVEVVAEDAADVGGVVGELVPRIGVLLAGAPDAVDDPAAVRMDEAAKQELGLPVAEVALPVGESDEAFMLAPRPVLGKQAGPVLRVGG